MRRKLLYIFFAFFTVLIVWGVAWGAPARMGNFLNAVIRGTLYLSDGTAAAPAYTFLGDIDTGFYKIGGNRLGVATGGNQRAEISSVRGVDAVGGLGVHRNNTLPATCNQGQVFLDLNSDDCADTGAGDGAFCVCKTNNNWALLVNY